MVAALRTEAFTPIAATVPVGIDAAEHAAGRGHEHLAKAALDGGDHFRNVGAHRDFVVT
jgi:hypothetical protein